MNASYNEKNYFLEDVGNVKFKRYNHTFLIALRTSYGNWAKFSIGRGIIRHNSKPPLRTYM